ncbi:FkbM family methyltransferase [Selenomonas ruminantium]|uniref:FkbM family methyltransferase n=1 Tax=Selenomonas ruminantium TaxID=971 RepID=UPI00055AB87D|nr:FkbM family methyltransferase [Selenomonas ruminantium]
MRKSMNKCIDFRYGKIIYNTRDQYIGKSLELYGEYSESEARIFEFFIKPGDTVVEVGANIGSHTVHLAQLVGDSGVVWAFEPQRLVFQLLAGNMAINGITNVFCQQQCVSDKSGTILVPVLDVDDIVNWGGLSLEHSQAGEPVQVITLDSLELPRCDFMKIDVEGMEQNVLQGARKTIEKYRPVIYMEADRPQKREKLLAYTKSLGYRIFDHNAPLYNEDNFFHNPENVFIATIPVDEETVANISIASINVICLPKESPIQINGAREL